MITRIGFFHFAGKRDNPIDELVGALETARSETCDIGHSLIVLPEGFNKGGYYRDAHQPTLRTESCLEELSRIAANYSVIFVTSLLSWPRNAAYFINRVGFRWMCDKRSYDGTERVYEHCTHDCDGPNPIEHGGAYIGVLICEDVNSSYALEVRKGLTLAKANIKVMCIPACMFYSFTDKVHVAEHWRGLYVVLANSENPDINGCGSFIATSDTRRVVNFDEACNIIRLLKVPVEHGIGLE